MYKETEIPETIKTRLTDFRATVRTILHVHFPVMLETMENEIQLEATIASTLRNQSTQFLNSLPISVVREFDNANGSFIGSSKFPVTHYHHVDPSFAALLGFSTARLFAYPLLSFWVNTIETDSVTRQLASTGSAKPTVAIFFYRTVTRNVVGVHWEITAAPIDGAHCARGVDITEEIEASRLKQSVSIQKMLRQWLHSIRNASFEQQARVILEEVQELEKRIGGKGGAYDSEFKSIYDCVRLLMHTARTSVGLIDHALDTKGLSQHMCVADFASNITSFPHHFAQSEGIPAIYTRYHFFLNGNPATSKDYSSFFVTGDVISIQSIVDNILSNAVRF
jgi:hypothetical protein